VRAHLLYLRYVLLHKLYVFAGGVAVARVRGGPAPTLAFPPWTRWLWRLLVHDLSKFRPSEWQPYVQNFYGNGTPHADKLAVKMLALGLDPKARVPEDLEAEANAAMQADAALRRDRKAQFNRAWLLHIHRNPHHWQHWILHEDSGKTLVLLPEAWIVDEMVADWLGAGTKVLARPTLAECVAETVKWYAANHQRMQLRDPVRHRVEETLMLLSAKYGLVTAALEVRAAEQARASITIPGR
jgi:hypothetical protein